MYGFLGPVLTPLGTLMLHWKWRLEVFQLQTPVSLIERVPARMTVTLPAAASAAATLALIGCPEASVSTNLTGIDFPAFRAVDFGGGDVKPPNPYTIV